MSEPAEKTDIMEADTGTDSVAEPEGSEMSDDVCQIVRSNKGGPKLIHRGYIYTVHKQRPGMVRWRCTRRSLNCRVIHLYYNKMQDINIICTNRPFCFFVRSGKHDHHSDQPEDKVKDPHGAQSRPGSQCSRTYTQLGTKNGTCSG